MNFASWKDRKHVAKALRDVYRAKDADAGLAALDAFEAGPWGEKYPAIAQSWRRNWEHRYRPLVRRVIREAERRGFNKAPRRVVLGDGAAWIWNLADEYFPGAIQIVDIFHAKGHLFEVAKAVYGPGTDLADQWAKQRRDELDQGRINALLAALATHAETCQEARKCFDYITRNRTRMQYPKFRAMGLCVATGVVEAGCRNIVATRLKRAGMHWTVNGANAIIALRCAILSNRFDNFWERTACAASS